jgi:hypothetical protein
MPMGLLDNTADNVIEYYTAERQYEKIFGEDSFPIIIVQCNKM